MTITVSSSSSPCTSILHITDMHIRASLQATLLGVNTAHYFQKVIQHAFASHNFDLVLLTGDLAQDPCPASYEFIREQLAAYNAPCICLPGNHDDYDIMQQVFNTDAINCRKQVILNNWQLISLNSQIIGANGGYLSDEELAFLDACLTEKPNHYALIAAHHHCLETQSTWMDTMMIENRYGLFAVIAKHPQVQAIVHGHIHQRMEIQTASVQILATPSTCFQFKPKAKEFALDDSSPGYRIIGLYADGHIESDVVRLSEPLFGLQMNMHGY